MSDYFVVINSAIFQTCHCHPTWTYYPDSKPTSLCSFSL